jgi:TonB family protein
MPFFLFPDQSRIGTTAARAPGADEKNAKWREIVLGMLVAKKDRLEELARSRGANGSVAIAFSVDDGGAIDNIELMRGSGQAELDAEALTMVREAPPFPPPPAGAIRKFAPIIAFGG